MPNPLVPQGVINRLRGSVVYANNQTLNITASYLAREAISISFEGDAGVLLPTLTGGVTSPEPYQMANVVIHMLKSQSLSSVYKTQFETNTSVGDVRIITDSSTLSDYQLYNCVLKGVSDLSFDGTTPLFQVTLTGIYYTNNSLWSAV
jgi:hypothetical protein